MLTLADPGCHYKQQFFTSRLASLHSFLGHFTAPHSSTSYSTGSCIFHLSLIVALARLPARLLPSVPLFRTPLLGSIIPQASSTAATQQVVVLISVHSTQQQSIADTTQSYLRPRTASSAVVYLDLGTAELTTVFPQAKVNVSRSSADRTATND
jgi:hypothetical protein